jgi:hypothetical protein
MSSRQNRSSAVRQVSDGEGAERVLGIRKLGGGQQYEIQWRGEQETTWEAASRVRRQIPQLVQEFEQQQQQQQQLQQPPKEGSTDSDEPMQVEVVAQPGNGAAPDNASLQQQVADLAQLVKQQAQRAEEHQQHARQQEKLIEQLRASPADSPQSSVHVSPQRSPQQESRSIAVVATAAAAQERAVPQSRFARKEPRAQDLLEYDGASGAKLDEWLKQLSVAARLYHLSAHEAVDFAGSRLRGAALDWWLELKEAELAAIRDATTLAAALRLRFQPVTAARTAREQLDKLVQGNRHVNDYIADFQRLSTQIGLASLGEDNALYAFERGLRRDVAVELRKQGITTLREAIALAARVGGLLQRDAAAPSQGRAAAANQMHVDDGDGTSLDDRITRAVLNAMQTQGSSGGPMAKTQTQPRGQQQESGRGGGRGGFRGGRGGRFGGSRGPPVVPGVSAEIVRQRLDAQQCVRCGVDGHRSPACPNAISGN